MLKDYLELTKYRLALVNVLVAAAAFVFASPVQAGSPWVLDWQTFGITLLGLWLIIASGCVFNNYLDRFLDARMERTKHRALPAGRVDPIHALMYGAVLLAGGTTLLFIYAHLLALVAALAGFAVYVFLYTPLKPKSGYALFVGALAGAAPPLVGYAAAAHTLDLWALAFFAFMFFWQIPHFLAIARYRFEEYTFAGVPLLVDKPLDEEGRRKARWVFYLSLLLLLLFCLTLILQRWVR